MHLGKFKSVLFMSFLLIIESTWVFCEALNDSVMMDGVIRNLGVWLEWDGWFYHPHILFKQANDKLENTYETNYRLKTSLKHDSSQFNSINKFVHSALAHICKINHYFHLITECIHKSIRQLLLTESHQQAAGYHYLCLYLCI